LGSLLTSWLVLAAALPAVEVEDQVACVDPDDLAAALSQELPDDPALSALTLRVQVIPLPARTDQIAPRQLSFALLNAERAPVLERSFEIAPVDCPALPRLVASVVGRQLEDLPRRTWARPRKRPITASGSTSVPPEGRGLRLVEPASSRPPVLPFDLRPEIGWGSGLGVERQTLVYGPLLQLGTAHLNTHLTLGASFNFDLWPQLMLALRASAAQQQLGEGGAQIFTTRAISGLSHDFRFSSLIVAPQLLLSAGAYIASGVDFDRNYVIALPLVAAHTRLVLYSKRVLFFWIEAEIPFVRAQLLERRGSGSYIEPSIRLHAGLGFALDRNIEDLWE